MELTNVLFYSPKCPFCEECLRLLEPYADQASFLGYVDIHKSRNSLPLRIRRVPTLVLNNGEIVYVGKQVYDWILKYISVINDQYLKKEQSTTPEVTEEEHVESSKKIDENALFSSSTLITSNDESPYYSSLNGIRTLSESIDYSKVRSVETAQTKIMLSPECIQDRRNSELEKIRPHPGNRF